MGLDSGVRTWAIAKSTNAQDGREIIFRYAQLFDPTFDRASQPIRIIIVWKYSSDSGQPVKEDHERMNVLEDALESALQKERFATLALVSTGENLREWTYYAKSEDEFMARLNFAFAGIQAFPIEIYIAHDSEWSTYEQFIVGVKETVN